MTDVGSRVTRCDELGIYVHIPFCRHRCHYCDFNTYEGLDEQHDSYVDALEGQIREWRVRLRPMLGESVTSLPRATSVFFGGGTPTLLAPDALGRILAAIDDAVGVAPDAEITVEANPETVTPEVLEGLLAAGFNRFSLGIQATSPELLVKLGRTHSADTALAALRAAVASGAASVNADLIYGSPWEREGEWRTALEQVVETGVQHVSAYALTVEEGTPLDRLVSSGRSAGVDPDVQAARYEIARAVLGAAGYSRYETSNWARPGFACRHNLLYWAGGNYLAFGAGAHGHVDGVRWWCMRLPRDFIAAHERGEAAVDGVERLASDERAFEAFALGLRLDAGLDLRAFAARFGAAWLSAREGTLAVLEREGWIERRPGRLRVAPDSAFVADAIVARVG